MIPADHEDRLERLRQRGKVLFQNMTRIPDAYVRDIEKAWEQALEAKDGPDANLEEASYAAIKASRLDSILSLLERITRPSIWPDNLSTWFGMAQCCLLDAAAHAGNDTPIPSPILAVEPIDSPLYVPRARVPAEWLPQATPADLPLPVVLCPGNLVEEPWAWATLFHELGHHLDDAREDTARLLKVIKAEEKRVKLGSWSGRAWVGEVVADLYAGLLGGLGAVETLKASFTTNSHSVSHPSDAARAEVLEAAWTGVRDGRPPSGDTPTEIVARALAEHFQPWQAHLQRDCEKPENKLDSARLLPGILYRRHAAGMKPKALREACKEAFQPGRIERPAWVLTPAHLDTLTRAMRNLVETRVQPGTETLKVPPLELLLRHDRISFVGATHGQLVQQLSEAMKHRKKPYKHIEIFALADAPLRELLVGEKTGEALIEERDKSLDDLRKYLTQANVPHRIYIYSQPYVFASYWDVTPEHPLPPGAPPAHLHVSSALWGMDLRHTVAEDLESPAGQPLPPAMQRRVEALNHLRTLSRELK